MTDLIHASDKTLAFIARFAFALGLNDGRSRTSPRTSNEVMDTIRTSYSYRVFHRKKIRQIYGAGFDIAKMAKKILTELEAKR